MRQKSLLILILMAVLAGSAGQINAQIRNGVLDLQEETLDKDFVISLNGEWEFFWKKYIPVSDPQNIPFPDLLIQVPGYWSDAQMDEEVLPKLGHGSYRLVVLLPESYHQDLALKIPVFDASYRLFVNGMLLASNGQPGLTEGTSKPGYQPEWIVFSPDSQKLEFIFHVANYHHRRGGFWKPVGLGHPEKIEKIHDRSQFVSYLSLGVIGAFSLFFLVFYIMFRKDYLLLFFSLTLLGLFLRLLSTGEFPIFVVADVDWSWLIRHEYMGSFMAFIFGMWYFYLLYPRKLMYHLTWINTFICVIAILLVWLLEVRVFAYSMLYFQPALLMFILYYLVISAIEMIRRKPGSLLYFTGLFLFILALINDILVANSRSSFSSNYIIHFAVQILVFLQAVLIIQKWINAYIEKERLNKEIEYMNRNLENLIGERTEELELRNKEIKSSNAKITEQNKRLKESLDFKNRVFSIIAHDLRSPIASLVQISSLVNEEVPKEEQKKILNSARNLVNSASDLIDNLLFWGRSQGNELKYSPSYTNLSDLLESVAELFVESAKQKSVSLTIDSEAKVSAWADRELMQIVLRNLISNALKFTKPGGEILLQCKSSKANPDEKLLIVKDSGVGMPTAVIQNIYNRGTIISTKGTGHEQGTGLGLHLCLDLVDLNKGQMHIESTEGLGTTIKITLPSGKP